MIDINKIPPLGGEPEDKRTQAEKEADEAREAWTKHKDEAAEEAEGESLQEAIDKKKEIIKVARQTMVGDLRDVCLQVIRDPALTGKAWKDMMEPEQKDVATKITLRVEDAVIRAIDIIGSDGEQHIKAVLEQVVIKDSIKAVFKCSKQEELRHALADARGDTILVVLTNSENYLGERESVEFDKDQPELPVDQPAEENQKEEEGYEEPETSEEEFEGKIDTIDGESEELT